MGRAGPQKRTSPCVASAFMYMRAVDGVLASLTAYFVSSSDDYSLLSTISGINLNSQVKNKTVRGLFLI